MPADPEFIRVVQQPGFLTMDAGSQRKALRGVGALKSVPDSDLDRMISSLRRVLPQDPAKPAEPQTPPPPGFSRDHQGTLARLGTDVKLGFWKGVSDVDRLAANATKPFSKSTSAMYAERAKRNAPTDEEMAGRTSILDMIAQGAGSLPGQLVKYGTAMGAGKAAPLVAGAIGAVGEADKGAIPAIKAGVRDAAGFAIQGQMAKLPTRLQRTVGSAAAMALPTAIESKGDLAQTGASAVLGGAMGAIFEKPKADVKDPLERPKEIGAAIEDKFRLTFAPQSRSTAAGVTGRTWRAKLGEAARKAVIADKAVKSAMDLMDNEPPIPGYTSKIGPIGLNFVNAIEGGKIDTLPPELQPAAKAMRLGFDQRWRRMNQLGLVDSFIENYYGRIFKKEDSSSIIRQVLGKKTVEGPKGFKYKRSFASLAEALDVIKDNPQLKLEMVDPNPLRMGLMKMREMDRAILGREAMNEMKADNRAYFVGLDGKPKLPTDKMIDDKVSTVFSRNPATKETILRGHYYTSAEEADLVNQHLAPGFRARDWFKPVNDAANTLNLFQLGWSAFHLGKTSFESAASNWSLALEKLSHGAATKDPKMFKSGLAEFPKAPAVALKPIAIEMSKLLPKKYRITDPFIEEYENPGTHPQLTQLVNIAAEAGARTQLDPLYRTSIYRNMRQAIRNTDNPIKKLLAGWRLPGVATEYMIRPIMEHIVPMQKMSAFMRLAEFEMSRLPANARQDMIRKAMGGAWDSVDNRVGQLVTDNLFWNKMTQNMLTVLTRSVTWNLGTLREIGGGMADWATIGKRLKSADPTERAFTHRMAYTIAFPMMAATVGSMVNYLNTGEAPDSILTAFFPYSGTLDEYGHKKRLNLWSYMKDVRAWKESVSHLNEDLMGPLKEAATKAHPLVTNLVEMFENKKWNDDRIWNEHDNAVQSLLGAGEHIGESLEPIAVQPLVEDYRREQAGAPPASSKGEKIASFFGIKAAPSAISHSEAEQYLDRHQHLTGAKSTDNAARFKAISDAEHAARSGKDPEAVIAQAVKEGRLTDSDASNALKRSEKRAAEPPLVRKIHNAVWRDALHAYGLALDDLDRVTKDELFALRDIVQEKIYTKEDEIMSLKPKDRAEALKQIHDLGLTLSTPETTAAPPGR